MSGLTVFEFLFRVYYGEKSLGIYSISVYTRLFSFGYSVWFPSFGYTYLLVLIFPLLRTMMSAILDWFFLVLLSSSLRVIAFCSQLGPGGA